MKQRINRQRWWKGYQHRWSVRNKWPKAEETLLEVKASPES